MTPEERAKYVWDYVGKNTRAGNENVIFIRVAIEAALREAVAEERERCAKVAEDHELDKADDVCTKCKFVIFESWERIAAAIRQGGTK